MYSDILLANLKIVFGYYCIIDKTNLSVRILNVSTKCEEQKILQLICFLR